MMLALSDLGPSELTAILSVLRHRNEHPFVLAGRSSQAPQIPVAGSFCLVGMVGCLLDLIVLGEKPFVEVFGWIIFTGLMAVVYSPPRLEGPWRESLLIPAGE